MQIVSSEFIKARQPYCINPVVIRQVSSIGGGIPNRCYSNAFSMMKHNPNVNCIVSGWIIKCHNPILEGTEIIQHYWNLTTDGQHIDSTFKPNSTQGEYVIDMDLLYYCKANDNKLKTHVSSSLLCKNFKFYIVDQNSNGLLSFNAIDKLKTEFLYQSKFL